VKPNQAPAIIIVSVAVLALIAWGTSAPRSSTQRGFDRPQLKIDMDAMRKTCSADTCEGLIQIESDRVEKALADPSLDAGDRQDLWAVWENNLAVCRSSARNQPKPAPKRR
jgi:hypothetical protein